MKGHKKNYRYAVDVLRGIKRAIRSRSTGFLYQASILIMLFMADMPMCHASTVTYYYTDQQGTPLATADAAGNILSTFEYKPYGGQVLGESQAGPGYTGHVNDPDSGLVYMQARYYDPLIGRFTNVDPEASEIGDVKAFGRYVYVNNNPMNHTDPSGKCLEDLCIVEAGIACAATPACAGAVLAVGAVVVGAMTEHAVENTPGLAPITIDPTTDLPSNLSQDSRSAPPPPLPEAGGNPHSIPDFKGGYVTYPDGDATSSKQYRPTGKPHGPIARPNVKESEPNVAPDGTVYTGKGNVRYPNRDEVPKNSPEPKQYNDDP